MSRMLDPEEARVRMDRIRLLQDHANNLERRNVSLVILICPNCRRGVECPFGLAIRGPYCKVCGPGYPMSPPSE